VTPACIAAFAAVTTRRPAVRPGRGPATCWS
jgi:hypothetical protein